MLTFHGGPADPGANGLQIRRAPLYLRVVRNSRTEKFDALDQLADTPSADEEIFAYKRTGEFGGYFWDGRDKNGRRTGGFAVTAVYTVCDEQPTDNVLRSTKLWQEWCVGQHAKEKSG